MLQNIRVISVEKQKKEKKEKQYYAIGKKIEASEHFPRGEEKNYKWFSCK